MRCSHGHLQGMREADRGEGTRSQPRAAPTIICMARGALTITDSSLSTGLGHLRWLHDGLSQVSGMHPSRRTRGLAPHHQLAPPLPPHSSLLPSLPPPLTPRARAQVHRQVLGEVSDEGVGLIRLGQEQGLSRDGLHAPRGCLPG
jgi:hypothetical protein